MGSVRWVLLGAALVAIPLVPVSAGEPVAARWTAWSLDGRFAAEMDPSRMETHVYRLAGDGARTRVWSMPGWSSRVSLANGGGHLVVAAEQGGVVPANYRPDDVLLRFYDHGHLVREVTLSEIVPDPREMIRVQQHYYWGRAKGFDARGHYVVETVDRTVLFGATGSILR